MTSNITNPGRNQIASITGDGQELRYVAPCVVGIIVIIGIVGNVFILIGLRSKREKRPLCFLYGITQNVTACDLGLLFLVCPIFAVEFAQESWIFGSVVCSMIRPLDFATQIISFYSLCFVSIDAAFAVANPHTYLQKQKGWFVWGSNIVLWALAIILAIPVWIFAGLKPSPKGDICMVAWPYKFPLSYEIYSAIFVLGVPLVTTASCIIAILANLSGKLWRPTQADSVKKAKEIVHLASALGVTGFVLCAPSYIVPLVRSSTEMDHVTRKDVKAFFSTTCFAYAYSCIKPMLYIFVYRDIRNMVADMIPSRRDDNIATIINGMKYKKSPRFRPKKSMTSCQRHYIDHRSPDTPVSTHSFPGCRSRTDSRICLNNMYDLQFTEKGWRRKTL
ncbi:melanin-concentrating hormone receptor 1-like [Diadema antillarum]|uniref:melanin-concentrating hormone receptor 1-like n=1 Tax=Diadema antillarum TaxID=105358 RepID=UPI003A84B904